MQKAGYRLEFMTMLNGYKSRLAAFHFNARLYLISVVLSGASMGVFRLLFNFYILSQGYDQIFLGNLTALSSLTALAAAVPAGYLIGKIGKKPALILGATLPGLAVLVMALWPRAGVFVAMNIVVGLGQSLSGITMGPFLMENSSEKERTYLFSFSSGLQTASGFAGNWIGGYLPGWFGAAIGIGAQTPQAYGAALTAIGTAAVLAAIPFTALRSSRVEKKNVRPVSALECLRRKPGLMTKLILPGLVVSIGAGLTMPFLNVFYRTTFHLSDPQIGALFAWGSLAMGIGLMIAPPLADRFGKVQLVVITQSLSIPFLAMMGFSPWFGLSGFSYYIRVALMNMSSPIYQTVVMEKVEAEERAATASLVSMAGNFGWAFSPTVSGWIQSVWGFGPAFGGTIVLYSLAVYLYRQVKKLKIDL